MLKKNFKGVVRRRCYLFPIVVASSLPSCNRQDSFPLYRPLLAHDFRLYSAELHLLFIFHHNLQAAYNYFPKALDITLPHLRFATSNSGCTQPNLKSFRVRHHLQAMFSRYVTFRRPPVHLSQIPGISFAALRPERLDDAEQH